MSSLFTLEWIAQFNQSLPLINQLIPPKYIIVQQNITPLQTGAIRFFFIIQSNTSDDEINEIKKEAQRLNYLPLTFTFNFAGLSDEEVRIYPQGLENILIAYLSCHYHYDIGEMEHLYLTNPNTLILKPLSRQGDPIYLSEEESQNIFGENYQHLLGYDLLTSDPLIWYYLNKENLDRPWYLTSWYHLAIIPMKSPNGNNTPFGDWWVDRDLFRSDIDRFISSLRLRGYFTLPFSVNDNLDYVRDIGLMWSIDYLGKYPIVDSDKDIHVFLTQQNFTPDAATWFSNSLLRLKLNELPLFYLAGEWVQYVEPQLENMARLQYAAQRSFQQIGGNGDIKCLPNLLIVAPFGSLTDVKSFQEYFDVYLLETKNWQVIVCANQEVGQRRIETLKEIRPDLTPLLINIPADPNLTYLVLDTSAGESSITLPS